MIDIIKRYRILVVLISLIAMAVTAYLLMYITKNYNKMPSRGVFVMGQGDGSFVPNNGTKEPSPCPNHDNLMEDIV